MEDLITLKTAKLAKKKGFNLSSPAYYGCDEPYGDSVKPNELIIRTWMKYHELIGIVEQEGTLVYSAPTQGLLQKWLRDVHDIHIDIITGIRCENLFFEYIVWKYPDITSIVVKINYCSYEECLEEALFEALKLIK